MGCQRAIAQKIVDKNADYILALKGNQGSLRDDVELRRPKLSPPKADPNRQAWPIVIATPGRSFRHPFPKAFSVRSGGSVTTGLSLRRYCTSLQARSLSLSCLLLWKLAVDECE
jgi:hypothetical protein